MAECRCRVLGGCVDKRRDPNYKAIAVYLRKALITEVKHYCVEHGCTQSDFVEELIMEKLHPKAVTFQSLLSGKDLELLVKPAGLPIEKLEAIAQGARPCDDDLIGLSRALKKTSDELMAIRKAVFGNGEKSEVKVRNGR